MILGMLVICGVLIAVNLLLYVLNNQAERTISVQDLKRLDSLLTDISEMGLEVGRYHNGNRIDKRLNAIGNTVHDDAEKIRNIIYRWHVRAEK